MNCENVHNSGGLLTTVNGTEYWYNIEIYLESYCTTLIVNVLRKNVYHRDFSESYRDSYETEVFWSAEDSLKEYHSWDNRMPEDDHKQVSEKIIESLNLFKLIVLEALS